MGINGQKRGQYLFRLTKCVSRCYPKKMNNTQLKMQAHIFVAKYPFDVEDDKLISARQREIDECGDENVKQSKFYSFKLLEYAVKKLYRYSLDECNLTRNAVGRWTSDKFEMSITHCDNIVAVALCNMTVGVDIQNIDLPRFGCKLRKKILTPAELSKTELMTEESSAAYANLLWTVKEAVFKRDGGKTFVPCFIDSTEEKVQSATIVSDNDKYYLSVAIAADCTVKYHCVNVEYKAVQQSNL